jgi:Na+-driven multidrug efflux pump
MTTIAIVIVLLVHPIVALFDVRPGTPIGDLAVTWIRMLGYGMPAVGIHIAFVGMLQGSGSTRTSLAVNALATLLFQVPLSAILGFVFDLGAFGIWISFPLSFVVRALLCAVAYKRGTWAKLGARAA